MSLTNYYTANSTGYLLSHNTGNHVAVFYPSEYSAALAGFTYGGNKVLGLYTVLRGISSTYEVRYVSNPENTPPNRRRSHI